MRREWRKYAPVGLIVAGLALLAAIAFRVIQAQTTIAVQISLAVVVMGLAAYVYLDPDRVREMLSGRQARYGSNSLVLFLATLGIIVVANYLAGLQPQTWDLTENKVRTLSDQTKEILANLPAEVHATAFYSAEADTTAAVDLLDDFKGKSDGKFDYEFIDPNANPVMAHDMGVTEGSAYTGVIVLSMGERREQATYPNEQEMTAALVRLMGDPHTVYFLIGHGEYSPEGGSEVSFSQLKSTLEGKNYTIETLNLLAVQAIPEDAAAIIIARPIKAIAEEEIALLSEYLDAGGSLIVMLEPTLLTDYDDTGDPFLTYLEETWGIVVGNDIVVDANSQVMFSNMFIAVAEQYFINPITERINNVATLYFTARSVKAAEEVPAGISVDNFVSTSANAWGETNLAAFAEDATEEEQDVVPDEDVDYLGPVSIAAIAENLSTTARVIVFGDAQFASDDLYERYANGDMLVNSVDWVVGQEDTIDLQPRSDIPRVVVSPGGYAKGLILFVSVFLIPGSVLGAGIVAWVIRRRRG